MVRSRKVSIIRIKIVLIHMLMCTARFNKETLYISICNQYPSLELTSPIYFSNGTTCHVSSSQQTDIDITMEASFGIAFKQEDFRGALLYKLRRKYATRTDKQHNSIASIKDTATNVYLLVALDIKNGWDEFYVCLIECTNDFTWDEDKLWALYKEYNDQFYEDYCYTVLSWLTHDGIEMEIRHKVTYGSDCKLDIFISGEAGAYNVRRPKRIDPKRLVLPLTMSIVLIHTASLSVQPSVKLNIHNQCWDAGLVSPVYVTGNGLECHRPPDYRVYAGDTIRSGFIINETDDGSYGVLIYRLQRRQSYRSAGASEDTSNGVHLFVVWEISEPKELYADVLLIEYTKAFSWNRDKLNKLYHENRDRLKECNDIISDTWLVDNNMVLKTSFSVRDLKGNPELSIYISEERDDYAMRPFCIDLTK
jgi:hypothetical protein